jgi:hypothetical protein
MSSTAQVQSFRHRENQDGSWDSICLRCYLTAAHSYREEPLASSELEHHCDESSWLFKEPVPALPHAPHSVSLARTYPASAIPRFPRPERIQFGRRSLRAGQPAGLREPVSAEAGCCGF